MGTQRAAKLVGISGSGLDVPLRTGSHLPQDAQNALKVGRERERGTKTKRK